MVDGGQENLSPVDDFSSSVTPLGWYPRPQRLIHPVPYKRAEASTSDSVDEPTSTDEVAAQPAKTTPVQLKEEANDPRAATTRRLMKYIARASGLDSEEVQRRATRKQRALVHVTGWMALHWSLEIRSRYGQCNTSTQLSTVFANFLCPCCQFKQDRKEDKCENKREEHCHCCNQTKVLDDWHR